MSVASSARDFVDLGTQQDDEKLRQYGVEDSSPDAIPYYTRWMRQDLVGIYFMLSVIAVSSRRIVWLLILIAIPLWMIALR